MNSIKCACKGRQAVLREINLSKASGGSKNFRHSLQDHDSFQRRGSFPRLDYLLNPNTSSLADLRNVDKLLLDLQVLAIKITLVTKLLNNYSKAKFELDFYCMSYFDIL